MKAAALKYAILSTVVSLVMVIIVLMPFHSFLTIWIASGLGHYTALRLWKEVLLLVCVGGGIYLAATDKKIRSHTLSRRLVQLVMLYMLVQIIWGLIAYHRHAVAAKALGYGWIIDTRFFAFFLVAWAIALRSSRLRMQWQKLLLWPAAVVIIFGLLQAFILPNNFLAHFGYGPQTIAPFETINHNSQYIRIESTLRGANPLGAYLLLPLSALTVLLIRGKRNWYKIALLIGGLVALFFTFSRSAWLGAIISIGAVLLIGVRSRKLQCYSIGLAVVLIITAGGLLLGLHNNARFENVVFHTQTHSAAKTSSDEGHTSALKSGLHDVLHEPLGRGAGTAGPASIYNTDHPSRIAENFFIQIGQETGWLGLLLFLLINAGVAYLLWLRRHNTLALSLLASLLGLSVINLLAHAWADDTLAYVWWGLAGLAMSQLPEEDEATKKLIAKK